MKPSWFRAMAVCAALALLPGRAACAAPPVAGAGFLAVAPVARGVPAAGEMAALDAAIGHYVQGRDALQTAPLEGFLAAHPASVYAVSLWFDIGRAHEQEGDYQAAAAHSGMPLPRPGRRARWAIHPPGRWWTNPLPNY